MSGNKYLEIKETLYYFLFCFVSLSVPSTCQLDHFLFTDRNPYYIPEFLIESHITSRIAYYNQLNGQLS